MNSVDPTIKPTENISLLMDEDNNCTVVDNTTGELCGESKSLKIIDELEKLYESRIQNVDQELEDEFEKVCVKLEISREWIQNLREQNIMLVQTVEDLEQAACNKVKLLEQKLNQSSMIVSENLPSFNDTGKTIHMLSSRVNDLEKDEKYMRQRIKFLESDIRGLLELIRRAAQENRWNLDGIKFFEIPPDDIPIPIDCTCDQKEKNNKEMMSLKSQIEHLRKNEKRMIVHQKELEDTLVDLNKKLETKEDTIKKYATELQNFSHDFKKHAKFEDQNACNSFTNDHQSSDIVLMADIVKHTFTKKDLETRNLQQRLYDAESNLSKVTRDMNINVNNLKVKLNEKCRIMQEIERQRANTKKELLEKQDALTAELAEKNETIVSLQKQTTMLQEQCHCASIQINFKEDIIKEMRKKMRKVFKETHVMSNTHKENQIILYLTKVKSAMEQENYDLFQLKTQLENLFCEKDQEYELVKSIDYLSKIYSKKEESIAAINSVILKLENNNTLYTEDTNVFLPTLNNQQSKLMDIFRVCAMEAQTSVEDIKNEMSIIAATFKSRHQKFTDLNKEVTNVQNQLIRTREKVTEAISKLQIREEEELRHDKRIKSGKVKLKDIKNELNRVQSRLSLRIDTVQDNIDESNVSNYAEICICNDLLHTVIEEVEQISNTLQVFHTHGCCIASDLEESKDQLCGIDLSIKLLQQKIEDALFEHDTVDTTLYKKEQKLEELERTVDTIYSRIQKISETLVSSRDHVSDIDVAESQLCIQTLNELLQIRQDLYGLRKEPEEVKHRMNQRLQSTECDEKTCLWKCKITDLQDQVKILKHEAKCNQEAHDILKNNIASLEEELHIAQGKAEDYRRAHSTENIELKKKVIELENTLKLQGEIECTLRQQLSNSEAELKRSKELLYSVHMEHNIEESLSRCDCNQFRYDTVTVSQLLKTVENTVWSTKIGLQDLKVELQKMYEDPPSVCSTRSLTNLVEKLQRYEGELGNCFQEMEKLKNAFCSKDKLLENRDEMIRMQKDAITMMRAELKELHQKLQEKIDNQDRVISQYEKEKKELSKQNELQIQTIGHLQNAVVEAKKCMDQMKQRTVSDLQENFETVRLLTVHVEETQSQYNECFAEAAKQDKLLELQRDVIRDLQRRIEYMERHNYLTINSICVTHYSILKIIQEKLEIRVNEIQALNCKIDSLTKSKCYLENTCMSMKRQWQETEGKLQELKKEALKSEQKTKIYENKECQCGIPVDDKNCSTEDMFDFNNIRCHDDQPFKSFSNEHELQSEIYILTRENEDLKMQLQKCKLDFDIIEKELRINRENNTNIQQISFELQKMKDSECYLRCENEQLRSNLEKQMQRTENLSEKLQFVKENGVKFEKLFKKSEDEQVQIKNLFNQISNNEAVIKRQAETIGELEKKLDMSNKQIKGYLSELNDAEEEMSALHNRIQSLKTMLMEKSDDMAKLQANYEILKNDNSILRMENNAFENKIKEDVSQWKNMLKEVQMQLCFAKDNYHRVAEDFNKTQDQLIKVTKHEADLQECLTNMEKDYCSKLLNAEKEKTKLRDCLDKFRDEFEKTQKNYLSKSGEHCKLQDICKFYTEQLEVLQQQIEKERDKVKKLEESNGYAMQQLQEYMEQNCILIKEKTLIEQNNCKIISELQETHDSLLELRNECQVKTKSLACISAELTETAISRSELCNQSQYVVSCIRTWMEEHREYVNKLNSKFKSQQQQLLQLEYDKKILLDDTKKLKRINHLLTQRLKRIHRYGGKNVRNVCVGCHIVPSIATQNAEVLFPIASKHPFSNKKFNLSRTARRVSTCGNRWWFPKMEYLINELRKSNLKYNENFYNKEKVNTTLEESRDCGYQSSASK